MAQHGTSDTQFLPSGMLTELGVRNPVVVSADGAAGTVLARECSRNR